MELPVGPSCFSKRKLHLAVTGSVAAYKALDLMRTWQGLGVQVEVTLTAAAQRFVAPLSFKALGAKQVYDPLFAPQGQVFAHLEPGQVAEVLVVAPATANALAKLACGLADDMFSCQALSFSGPLVIAPAMNPRLWSARATQSNVLLLRQRGFQVLEPESGFLACGEQGQGRLPEPRLIALEALRSLAVQDLSGKQILVNLGPTREHFDPIRFWSNPSSGRTGAAVAVAAWLRGAQVHVVKGPCPIWLPPQIEVQEVTTALEMSEACSRIWPEMDFACLTAAVCDFRPQDRHQEKFKKSEAVSGLNIHFANNPDILSALGRHKAPGQCLIGFAAETSAELETLSKDKLRSKGLDLILANRVDRPGLGFGSRTNQVLVLDTKGRQQSWPCLDKGDIAWRIWDWILGM